MTQRDLQLETIDADSPQGSHVGSFIDLLYHNRGLIAAVTSCFALIGVSYAMLAEPVYQSDILVQVEENQSSARNLLSDVSSMFAVHTAASAEIEVLRSRMVISRAVDRTKLYINAQPHYFPVVGKWIARHLPGLVHSGLGGYAWGDDSISVPVFDVPGSLYGAPFVLKLEGGGAYSLSTKELHLQGRVGELMHVETPAGPIDLMVDQVSGQPGSTFELARHSRLSTIETLQKSLLITEKGKQSDVIGVALENNDPRRAAEILNAIGSEYVKQNMERTEEEAEKSIRFLERQLPDLKTQLEAAESKFNTFRSEHGTVDLNAEATALLQRSVESQGRIADLKQQREQLLARFTSEHPAVVAIDSQLAAAGQELDHIAATTKALPPLEQNLLRLQRDVQVNTDLYTNLLNTQEQLRLLKAGKVGNVRLVDSAIVPESPIRPKRAFAVAGAVLTGLFLSIATVLVKRKLIDGVGGAEEIEYGTGMMVYAQVPRSKLQEQITRSLPTNTGTNLVLARASAGDAAIESLRSFRSALEFALLDAPNKIVLLAGPTPVVGKSFVSVNLATLIGSSGQRVLLIDADLRRGSLHHYLGATCTPGVTEMVVGGMSFEDVVRRGILPGVDFVASGGFVPNPSEILMHSKFIEFTQRIEQEYDVVLIDAPPILPVADSGIVAKLAGNVFVIARQGVTNLAELRESARRFAQIGVPIRGVIFNDMTSRPSRYGKEYGAYGYTSYGSDSPPEPAKE
ncbi:polysaccharide biosynthesis tyrosine autokinase [Paraburkholderia solisilvae]|uniref:Tyrosine-protein kinase wzc n=1 Tax=Paraburkholderia solisilvae TaxID=624376 RepID=A0A6J5DVG2_9BURK|nr:polysaccharide biosynthesis tyrosine autokinase [Paraburkholderia solisilvae]CAB3758240.1 Tyrosine-protein kinase wzc [Paraburkholderia solisilvae]